MTHDLSGASADTPASAPLYDHAIVGAGIAGASLAWTLAQQAGSGRTVLLERESQPGYHSTGRSAALYMASYGTPQIRALTRASRAFYDAPPSGFTEHPLLTPRGVLHVATADQQAALDAAHAELHAVDPSVRRVTQAELLATVPALKPEAAHAGLSEDSAADIDVHALHQGYLRGYKQAGGQLLCDAEVAAAQRVASTSGPAAGPASSPASGSAAGADPDHWQLTLADGRSLRARVLVIAAGAWADVVGALAGAAPIGLQPKRRSAFTFAAPEGVDASRWPAIVGVEHDWYVKPDAGLLLGSPANADPVPPHDVQPEELDIATGIWRIEEATTLQIRRPRSTWAGLRSFVPDGDIVIGWDGAVDGLFWVAAQGGYGIQSAPAAAALAASLLRGEALPAGLAAEGVEPQALSPQRLR